MPTLRAVLAWGALFLAAAASGVELPQAQAQAAPEPLPFVDASGWVRGSLNYSAVVARFGDPPVAHVSSESTSQKWRERSGGHLTIAYPELGLSFMIERQHRAAADPVVDSMRLTEPWPRSASVNAPTGPPERRGAPLPAPRWIVSGTGLHVGMPATAFDALVASRHRIDTDYRGKDGNGSLTLDDAEWGGRRGVSVSLDRGQVSAVTFESTARPLWPRARRVIGPVLMIMLALVAGTLWQRARGRSGQGGEAGRQLGHGIRRVLGGLFLAGGAALGWVSWRSLQNGGGASDRLGALVVGAAAAGALMLALLIFSGMHRSVLGSVSKGLLVALVAVLVVGSIVGKLLA